MSINFEQLMKEANERSLAFYKSCDQSSPSVQYNIKALETVMK